MSKLLEMMKIDVRDFMCVKIQERKYYIARKEFFLKEVQYKLFARI